MSRSLNKVQLIGNVGNDPEIRMTIGGTKVANLSLATNRQWSGRDGQQQEKTDWHRLTFFGKLAEVVEQYVTKGTRMYVEGRIEYSDNGKEGTERRIFTSIVVQEMMLLGGGRNAGDADATPRSNGNAWHQAAPASTPMSAGFSEEDDDLPF